VVDFIIFPQVIEKLPKFILKEEIIKTQHNCTSSKMWEDGANKWGFYLIMHEHLFVFRKPKENENLTKLKWSSIL